MMFVPRGQFGMARYRSVDLASRIEGASPHQLVLIMFEEAVKALEAMAVAAERGDYVQRGIRQSRALSIIHGLEGSLDYEQGGEIASGLAAIYREARRLAIAGGRENDPASIRRASEMLNEIATAWTAIGERGA
jgi:flagellar secretion chaperone FliS